MNKKIVLLGTNGVLLLTLGSIINNGLLLLPAVWAIIPAVLFIIDTGFLIAALLSYYQKQLQDQSASNSANIEKALLAQYKNMSELLQTQAGLYSEVMQVCFGKQEQILKDFNETVIQYIGEIKKQQTEFYERAQEMEKKRANDSIIVLKLTGDKIGEQIGEFHTRQENLFDEKLDDLGETVKDILRKQSKAQEEAFVGINKEITETARIQRELSEAYSVFKETTEKITGQSQIIFEQLTSLRKEDIELMEKLSRG
jgi:hypothetical protein